MKPEELTELAALQAVGALDGADAAAFCGRLTAGDGRAWAEFRAFNEALAAAAASQPAAPPAGLREKLMRRIGASAAPAPPAVPAPPPLPAGVFQVFNPARHGDWLPASVPGARFKMLSLDLQRNFALLYAQLDPGTRYPAHHHSASEECYVLTGDLTTEGRMLRAGDFYRADAHTDHEGLFSAEGCTALFIVPARDLLAALPTPSP
ncbi:MAG: cupin domain-containing protein [Limisphaerales bacterium]